MTSCTMSPKRCLWHEFAAEWLGPISGGYQYLPLAKPDGICLTQLQPGESLPALVQCNLMHVTLTTPKIALTSTVRYLIFGGILARLR